jgi:HEPN domain-containing protein
MKPPPPKWGNLVYHADYDFIAFGVLLYSFVFEPAYFHGAQAIEKYLKALALTIFDPSESKTEDEWRKFLKKFSHNLAKLGNYCCNQYPYLKDEKTISALTRFSEFNSITRYPWVESKLNPLGTSEDIPIFDLIKNLRNSLPIIYDDYPLGIYVRGYFYYNIDHKIDPANHPIIREIEKLRIIFPELNSLVRFKDND